MYIITLYTVREIVNFCRGSNDMKDKISSNSSFKCVKTTQPLFYILSSCVLTLSQKFPKIFKPLKS